MKKVLTPRSTIFEALVALYITTLIVSNIASVKLVGIAGLVFDAGTILFPLAYVLGDIITEVYGFRRMRNLVIISIAVLLLAVGTFTLVGALPAASDWTNQASYEQILGTTWRIITASIVAIFLGETINAYVLATMKIKTEGKKLWTRLIGSSAVGNLVDTTVFSVIAFAGTVSISTLLTLIATVYVIKTLTEIVISPFTMRAIAYIKKRELVDVYERPNFF